MSQNISTSSIMIMLLAMSLVPLGDTAGKLLTQAGIEPFFVAWSRFFIAAICLLPFSGLKRQELLSLFNWRILLRGFFISGSICSILTALSTEPIANVFATLFIAPVIAYFLAAWLLKEQISTIRTVLLLIGFCGVLLVVKPGFGMTKGIGFGLLTGCFYSGYLTCNRWLVGQYRPRFMLISQLLFGSVVLAPLGLQNIPAIDTQVSLLVLLSALASAIGNLLLVETNRRMPSSVAAPLVYTQLIFASLYGIIVFNTWPDLFSQIGLVILVSSGFSSWWIARQER